MSESFPRHPFRVKCLVLSYLASSPVFTFELRFQVFSFLCGSSRSLLIRCYRLESSCVE
uniref:Uncharacterized protein n=1 Tax=Anguilla anguilla TaxID=7936 RepID=A0A0E9UPD0_ANGAN